MTDPRIEAVAKAMAKEDPMIIGMLTDDELDALARAALAAADSVQAIDVAHLKRQREWSEKTFGPGARTLGILDHIRKELDEIANDPTDVMEWVDVIILAFDGAWRAGWPPDQIIQAIKEKQAANEERTWPDWRTQSQDKAIEHDRAADSGHGKKMRRMRDLIQCLIDNDPEDLAADGGVRVIDVWREDAKRVLVCEVCGGDGEFFEGDMPRPAQCTACGGAGEYEVKDEPIALEDLDHAADSGQEPVAEKGKSDD